MTQARGSLVATVFVVQAVAIGGSFGAFPVFVAPLVDAFDASLTLVSAGVSLIALMLGIMGPIWGRWIDAGEFRKIMLCGSVALSLCFAAASLVGSIASFAIVCIGMGTFMPLVGPLTGSALIGKVFVSARGRAMGLASMGPPAGSALFALLAGELVSRFDWRTTYQVFAVLMALTVPLIVWQVPRRVVAAPTAGQTADDVWSRRRLLRERDFWCVATAMGIASGVATGWGAHVVNFVLGLGHPLEASARISAIAGAMGIVGTLLFGTLADRVSPRWLLVSSLVLEICAFAAYLAGPSYPALVAIAALFGICTGGVIPLYALILTTRFGASGLGQALGMTNLFILPFGVLMPTLAGALRETSGSYALPIVVLIGVLLGGAASLIAMRSDRRA